MTFNLPDINCNDKYCKTYNILNSKLMDTVNIKGKYNAFDLFFKNTPELISGKAPFEE